MPRAGPLAAIRTYASFVKLSHTVFALPFAITGMVAAYAVPTDGFDRHVPFSWTVVALILCCMVGARSFAMAVNRILDRRIDALNPRTAGRELPAGKLSQRQACFFAGVAAAFYFAACGLLGDVVFTLSLIPVALMALYPFTKCFTALCHLVLGASLGLAPVGAWIAVRALAPEYNTDDPLLSGEYIAGWRGALFGDEAVWAGLSWGAVHELAPWVLGGAVLLWVAGFDVIYALQDDEFDRANKLHSIPARFGRRGALWISRAMHALSAACFFAFIWLLTKSGPMPDGSDLRQYTRLASWVWAAPCVMIAGMVYQHSLVRPNDLSRVNLAFFTVNGVISIAFGAVFVSAWLSS